MFENKQKLNVNKDMKNKLEAYLNEEEQENDTNH
jgi:hypothetical protein